MVKAVRGATTVDSDDKIMVVNRVCELVDKIFKENELDDVDVVSLQFSITDDIVSINPAAALRAGGGYCSVPLFCSQEPKSLNALPMAIRVLITWNDENNMIKKPSYLHRAEILRPDLIK